MLEEAIAHQCPARSWHRARHAAAADRRAARNLFFERPLMSVLRPRFIIADQYTLIQRACGLRWRSPAPGARALEDATLWPIWRRSPARALIARHPLRRASAHSRMDTFLTVDGTSLQFVEQNAESPAAIAYEDAVGCGRPIRRHTLRRALLLTAARPPPIARNLLAVWRVRGAQPNHRHSGLKARRHTGALLRPAPQHNPKDHLPPDELSYRWQVMP
jgi:hypothetical protein